MTLPEGAQAGARANPGFVPKTAEHLVERLAETARHLQQLRAANRTATDYEHEQAQHWFYCLAWVTGFDGERRDRESLDSFLSRAAKLRPAVE